MLKTITKTTILWIFEMTLPIIRLPKNDPFRFFPGPAIRVQDMFKRRRSNYPVPLYNLFNNLIDMRKLDLSVQKCVNRNFIRGIENARQRSPFPSNIDRQS